jgi:hypothetical protein
MAALTIHLQHGTGGEACGLCGRRTTAVGGTRLCRADNADTVCRECGQRHAPALVALFDLACVAERVGNIGRHTLTPPLEEMLALVRAAENYTHSPGTPTNRARAA